jgi:antitoxin Phd
MYKTATILYAYGMNTEPTRPVPEEISVSDARASLGELAEAAAMGRVIHLTKHGRRIAAIVPEHSQAEVDEAFMASVDKVIDRYREMFDRLAEL